MGIRVRGIMPDTPVYGVLYDYFTKKRKYPTFKEAKAYLESLGWSINASLGRWVISPRGHFSLSRNGSYSLTADDVKQACVIARKYDIREVEVELLETALLEPVHE